GVAEALNEEYLPVLGQQLNNIAADGCKIHSGSFLFCIYSFTRVIANQSSDWRGNLLDFRLFFELMTTENCGC
ncbi:MAG: hypothetical protein ACI4P4_11230, partial [Faecousia sp.]